jgi:preprotein translocase subunit YajC
MRKIFTLLLVFIIGVLSTFLFVEKTKKHTKKEQTQVILNGIKKVQKLVVTEGSFSEIYSYEDSNKYFFETLSFDKKAIIAVNATVQISYDLAQLEVEVDSINKIIKLKHIPKEELTIIPDLRFFDLQQSQFNSFTASELNTIRQNALKQIKENARLVKLRDNAKKNLIETLENLFILSQSYGWKIEETQELRLMKMKLLD